MQLQLLNFPALVSLGAAAAQKACKKLLNLTTGSVTRSVIEASGSLAMWIQYLIVQIWLGSRLATSTGADVDTYVEDFTLAREPAVASTGIVTLSRPTTGFAALIKPYFNVDGTTNTTDGVQVITVDRVQSFGVTVDTTNTAWNAGLGGYFVATDALSVDVPVMAIVAGSAGNVQAGTISLLTVGVPGIDSVTNAAVFSNGVDAETDDALKERFRSFIATRARATIAAVQEAISSVQQGLTDAIIENTLPTGETRIGFFTVTIDDGSGAPTDALINAVAVAIDQVRPIGSVFSVRAPAVIFANVNMTIDAAAGFSKATLQGNVSSAIQTFINGLGIGQKLSYTRLPALAFGVAGVSNVSNVLLNSGTADIGGGPTQVVKATSASVVIN
jgi:uncharacterized phage protein gp47/JayE